MRSRETRKELSRHALALGILPDKVIAQLLIEITILIEIAYSVTRAPEFMLFIPEVQRPCATGPFVRAVLFGEGKHRASIVNRALVKARLFIEHTHQPELANTRTAVALILFDLERMLVVRHGINATIVLACVLLVCDLDFN